MGRRHDGLTAQPPPLLTRYGLHRPELRAWVMYDWANSALMTTIVAAVFPIYFAPVAAVGLLRHIAEMVVYMVEDKMVRRTLA